MISNKKTTLFFFLILSSVISSSTLNTLSLNLNQEKELNQIQWSTLNVLSKSSTSSSINPSIVYDNEDNLYTVWEDSTDYNGAGATDIDIFYKKYNATTQSWGPTVLISTDSSLNSFYPSIAVDSMGNLHVVWYDYLFNIITSSSIIYYKNYNVTTQSWGSTVLISTESSPDPGSSYPAVMVDSRDNVHVVWQDATDYDSSGTDIDIFYKKYNATTKSWGTTVVISTESSGNSLIPSIAIDIDDNVHVVWQDTTAYDGSGTDIDIFYKKYNATTKSWGNTVVISTESTGFANSPSIGTDSKTNLHVGWDDDTDYSGAGTDTDIFYKIFNSTSQIWGSAIVVSTESDDISIKPKVTLDKFNNIHFVWEDITNYSGAGTDPDIFYKTFNFELQTWTSSTVISTTASKSKSPAITTDSISNLHIVWGDETDYNGAGSDTDIFYKTGIIVPQTPVLNRLSTVNNPEVALDWDEVAYTTEYKIYRSSEPIYDVSGLSPIANISATDFSETLNSTISNFYFFVIVASNLDVNSGVSNIVHVEIEFIANTETNTSTENGTVSGMVTVSDIKTVTKTATTTVTENVGQTLEDLKNNDLFIPILVGSGLILLTLVILLRKRKKKRK